MRCGHWEPILTQKLVMPRLLASAVMLPLLTIIADFIGMIGGFLSPRHNWGSRLGILDIGVADLEYNDIAQGLLKPFTFAVIIASVGCFYGMKTSGGTQGVGRATTDAVVWSSLWIIISNACDHAVLRESLSMDPQKTVVRFEDVSLHFGDTPALDHVSFEMGPGETRVVFGAAGSGKTVLAEGRRGLGEAPDRAAYFC